MANKIITTVDDSSTDSDSPTDGDSSTPLFLSSNNTNISDPFSWNMNLITPGYIQQPPIDEGVHDFITAYDISDREYKIEILEEDCTTPSTVSLPLISAIDNITDDMNHLTLTFRYNQSVIESGSLWNSSASEANFCVQLNLYLSSSLSTKVQYHQTLYRIEVDYLAGFSTEVNVISTAADDGGVDYLSDDVNVTA